MTSHALTSARAAPADAPASRPQTRLWLDFVLFWLMLSNLALALAAAQWSLGLEHLALIAGMAVIAGTLLALSDFSIPFALFYGTITGTAAILYQLSDMATGLAIRQERVYQIVGRAWVWLMQALNGNPGSDSMIFVLVLAILLWLLSFNATWVYFRDQRKWQAILPTGLVMLGNLYYAPHDLKIYFIIYLALAMLLLLRATLNARERQWRQADVYFPFDMGFDVMPWGILFVVLIISFSWVLPTALNPDKKEMVNPLEDPVKQLKTEWNRLFSTLNYGDNGAAAPSIVFTPSHPLGGARSMSNEAVMDVRTTVNRYFQATLLDTYTSQSWELRNTVNANQVTGYHIPVPVYEARRIVTQTITMRQRTNVILGAPMPLAVDVPTNARMVPQGLTPEEALTAEMIGAAERGLILSHELIEPGQSYTVTSAISFATETQLRHDNTAYPPDVLARYLQLPEDVPQRVFDLAEKIAAGQDNPYDVAQAIERFLRGYTYNDQIPGPAAGQDAADYFLFEEKEGYCDYYATSMAVMLRHLGIPTRLAQGYASGEFNPLTNSYHFIEKDAHIWVEVFFPTYGWIQFEPTSSEPAIQRQTEEIVPPEEGGRASVRKQHQKEDEAQSHNIPQPQEATPSSGLAGVSRGLWQQLSTHLGRGLLLMTLAGLLLAAVLSWRVIRQSRGIHFRRSSRMLLSQDFLHQRWQRLLWWGRRLNVPQSPSLTPAEQVAAFTQSLPQTSSALNTLADLYAQSCYSPHPLPPTAAQDVRQSWKQLQVQFIRAWLRRVFKLRNANK